jgi:hypothetical protein
MKGCDYRYFLLFNVLTKTVSTSVIDCGVCDRMGMEQPWVLNILFIRSYMTSW